MDVVEDGAPAENADEVVPEETSAVVDESSGEKGGKYKDGDIVWVKLSYCWWPGEVKDIPTDGAFKKPPLYIVKFFEENFFEYIRNEANIYAYQCEKKTEFIKKGLSSNKIKEKLEKFKSDIILAESRTNGNKDILNDPQVQPEKKVNYVAEVFGTAAQRRAQSPKKKGRKSGNKSNSQAHITHRRFLGWDDFESLEMIQYVGKDRKPASDDEEMQQLNSDPEEKYYCAPCNFTCHRLEIFKLHSTQHLKGIIDGKGKQKRPYHKKARKTPIATTSTAATLALSSDEETSAKKKRRRSKKTEKKDETEERKRDIAKDLLTEWNEDDDEDLDDIMNTSTEQQSMNKSEDKADEDNEEKNDNASEKSEREVVKPAKERSKEVNKSCFDFDDDETNDEVAVSPSGSRKIPRVIPEVRKSTESATNGENSNNNKDSESEDVAAAFKELMESTAVPELPDVGASSVLKAEQNFHSGKTIKFPDKSAADEPSQSKSVATKLTNPKKRFVKSFEDFEQYMNEQRRMEEEKNLQSNNSGTTMAPAAIADVNDTAGESDEGKAGATAAVVAATNSSAMDTSAKSNVQKKVEERATRRSSRLSRPLKEEEQVPVVEEAQPEPTLDPFDALLRSSELEKRKIAGKTRGRKSLDDSDLKKPKLDEEHAETEKIEKKEEKEKEKEKEEVNRNSRRSRRGKKWSKQKPKVKKAPEENNQLPDNAIEKTETIDSVKETIDDPKISDTDENQKEIDKEKDKSDDTDKSKNEEVPEEITDIPPEPEKIEKPIEKVEKKNDATLEEQTKPEKKVESVVEKDNDLPKFSKDSFVFTYKTRRSNFLKNQSESSTKAELTESKDKKITDQTKEKKTDPPKEKKSDPIVEKEKTSRRYSARLSVNSDNSDADIDKKLEKMMKPNETKVEAKKIDQKKKSPEKDYLYSPIASVDDDSVDINQLKSSIALKIREAAESVPSKRLGMQHRTPRSKFLESYRQEGLNNEPGQEKLDNEPKSTLASTPLISPAINVATTTSTSTVSTLSYIKKDKYLPKKNIWSKTRYQSPRRENYDDSGKPRENKFFTSRRAPPPPVETKPEVKEEIIEVREIRSFYDEVVEEEEDVKQVEKIKTKRISSDLRKSLEKSPKREMSPMKSPKREQSPRKIESSPKQSPKKENIDLVKKSPNKKDLQSPTINDNPKSPLNKDAPIAESPKTEIKLPENTCKDAFDFPQTQADLPDDFISKPKPVEPKPVVEEKTTNDKDDMYDDIIIDPSKKVPPIDESAILNIETNATVVSEKDLADGQVEIAAVSASKPVTLMNFSMDYPESKKDTEVAVNSPEVVPKTVVKPQQTVLNQLVTSPFIKDPIGAEKRLASGQKLITPAKTLPKAAIALSKSLPVTKGPIAKPIQIPKTITLSKSASSIVTKPAVVAPVVTKPTIAPPVTKPTIIPAVTKPTIAAPVSKPTVVTTPAVVAEKSKLQNALEEKPKATKPLPKNDDICDFEDHIPSQIVNKEPPKLVESPTAEIETKSKPVILSEKIIKPPKRNINDVEFVLKGSKKLAVDDGGQKGKPKAKILQQTIITPAGEIISGAGGSSAQPASVADEFDINSMPIVLSDEILTPESIEKMSIVLDNTPTTQQMPVKKAVPRILNKSTPAVNMPLISKSLTMQRQKVYSAVSGGNKIIKTTPQIVNQKGNKYIVMQGSAAGASNVASPLTSVQKIIKKPMVIRKPTSSPLSESKGNKVMIVTNQQGQQQRLLLTPAQQKMIGYQSPAIDKTKLTLQKVSPASSNKLELKNSSSLKTVAQPMKLNKSIVGKKIVVQNQSLYPADANTTQSVQKQLLQQQHQQVKEPAMPVVKKQKTILIKNQHGQLVKKIQGTDDALLDKQVAEQIEAIKASSAAAVAAQNRAKEAAQVPVPKKQIRRPPPKKIATSPAVTTATSLPPALSPIKQQQQQQPAPAEDVVVPKPAEEAAAKPDRPLNQLVIQDAMGIQTTITEGQILALPSETVGGQPQSYMLVTLDESGNLTPLNNEALMSLDPNLVPGGDLSNMVLQIDQSGIQSATAAENAPAVPEPESNLETVVTTTETPAPVSVSEVSVPEPEIPPPVTVEQQQVTAPVQEEIPEPPAVNPDELANQVVGGQQLILTGDPEATQKFLESLSTNADLSNLLANAEGSILIQADGQQILINTNTVPAEAQQQQQLILNVTTESTVTEDAGNPVFSGQQQQQNKFQDILAAALADTDFQEPNAQNKPSQLSPGGYQLVPNVLDTTLALNSPIMTPLEVPSSNNKKIADEEADILTHPVPKNIDLPITITDPNISQTVMAQQQQQVGNFGNELQELALPISTAAATAVATDSDKSLSSTESFAYSLPTLDEIQKPLSSMPLLTDEEEIVPTTENTNTSAPAPPTVRSELEEEEGLCTLGGEMCSSLSEPPPEMFELQARFDDESLKYSNGDTSGTNTTTPTSNTDLGVNDEDNSNSTRSEGESSTSCEIPLQPQIETVPAIMMEGNSTDVGGASSNSSSSDAKFD